MVINCRGLNVIWRNILQLLRFVIPRATITDYILFFGPTSEDLALNTLVNTILSITRWNIWKRRCTKKFDDKLKPIDSCLKTAFREIGEHLDILIKNPKYSVQERLLKGEIPIDTG